MAETCDMLRNALLCCLRQIVVSSEEDESA